MQESTARGLEETKESIAMMYTDKSWPLGLSIGGQTSAENLAEPPAGNRPRAGCDR